MTKERALTIATRNVKKAEIAYNFNYNRSGVTEQERQALSDHLEYAQMVYELLKRRYDYGTYNCEWFWYA